MTLDKSIAGQAPDRTTPGRAQRYRLPAGGAIDRNAALSFTFNGTTYKGFRGDTLASALLANGVHLVARSFKYHRPRGIVSAGPEEPCALVRVGEGARAKPNLPATMVELYDGLTAATLNAWPSVRIDFGAIINAAASWFPAGFYYKTFMWPARAWMLYERVIRNAAGLGVTPDARDPDRYDKRFEHCDVLVIGGGPAGISAALAAGRAGARVVLADERVRLGGQLVFRDEQVDGVDAPTWIDRSAQTLASLPDIRVLTRTTATGYYDHNCVVLVERTAEHVQTPAHHVPRQRLWKVFAKEVIVATGAIERPLVFDRNDVPGVMLAGAAQRYVKQYGVKPGSRAVVFTNNDSGHEAAAALAQSGIDIAAIVDPRRGEAVVRAHGRQRVRSVTVSALAGGASKDIRCDLVCVSGGWDPAVHLYSHSGGKLTFDQTQQCFVPHEPAQRTHAAGAANGAFVTADCVREGSAAGLAAAEACGYRLVVSAPGGNPGTSPREAGTQAAALDQRATSRLTVHPQWKFSADAAAKAFVDLQHDVTTLDLGLAAREGYVSVEHAKRYTTAGMGIDQGKTGNVIAFGLLGDLTGRTVSQVGTTTFRPPYTPITIGALAGRDIGERFDPVRRTPISDWHEAAGAVFEPVGLWRRPLYYPRAGEDMHAAVARECLAARNGVALLDASTLGKIDVQGRDALTLLNLVYANAWDTLAVGRCRYGLMLGEDGMVMDDGVTTRLGEQHYLISTTSGGADRVYGWLEDWIQCEWRGLQVYLTPVTAHWATICVTGPRTREIIGKLKTDIDFSPAAFPHMHMREGTVGGIRARVMRVSFTGELSYEINVPARHARALWDMLLAAGAGEGITPLGTEALHVLRAEKGFIAVGHETDGTVNPFDLGLERLVNMKKPDFLGKRGLRRSDNVRPGRKQLVGLITDDTYRVVTEGSQIVGDGDERRVDRPPVPMIGHVTSSYMSATLGRSIALALIENGRSRVGERVHAVIRGMPVAARISAPVFFDPAGARLNA